MCKQNNLDYVDTEVYNMADGYDYNTGSYFKVICKNISEIQVNDGYLVLIS